MREYARISPRFWMGETGRLIRSKGADAQLLALYLLTSPHSNMIGLYWCPVTYMAHETGMSMQGASKALQSLVDIGFCKYDGASEVVWVIEMARYQVGDRLSSKDKQAKGVQNSYDDLPKNLFLQEFFDRYGEPFCMTHARAFEAPSEQGEGTGEGEGTGKRTPTGPVGPVDDVDALFEEFWQAYPRKVGKDAARRSFFRRKPTRAYLDEILQAIDVQRGTDQWTKDRGQYIPHPSTWLNQGRWMDEVEGGAQPQLSLAATGI